MSPATPSFFDHFDAPPPNASVADLLAARAYRWVKRDDVTDTLANMTVDGLTLVTLPSWTRGWLPAVLSLLGFSGERLLPGSDALSRSRFALACQLLSLVGALQQPLMAGDGLVVFRQPPTIHAAVIHGYHLLAARAGLAGYSAQAQHALAKYMAWQQLGDPLSQLSRQQPEFLRHLQPAITRDMEALALLSTLCNTVLAPAYESDQLKADGIANG